eukprot:9480744-Pyramimonas_sp.AAC.1
MTPYCRNPQPPAPAPRSCACHCMQAAVHTAILPPPSPAAPDKITSDAPAVRWMSAGPSGCHLNPSPGTVCPLLPNLSLAGRAPA